MNEDKRTKSLATVHIGKNLRKFKKQQVQSLVKTKRLTDRSGTNAIVTHG